MTPAQSAALEWLANGETGVSSETMAFWLAFEIRKGDGSYPHDPADLDRCLLLLDRVPEMRAHFHRMAEINPVWAALVENWERIEASHTAEVGLGWTKAGSAPKTYALMCSIIEPAERVQWNAKDSEVR